VRSSVENESSAEGVGTSAETLAPQRFAEYDQRRSARFVVG
jgi:hypothetical protein